MINIRYPLYSRNQDINFAAHSVTWSITHSLNDMFKLMPSCSPPHSTLIFTDSQMVESPVGMSIIAPKYDQLCLTDWQRSVSSGEEVSHLITICWEIHTIMPNLKTCVCAAVGSAEDGEYRCPVHSLWNESGMVHIEAIEAVPALWFCSNVSSVRVSCNHVSYGCPLAVHAGPSCVQADWVNMAVPAGRHVGSNPNAHSATGLLVMQREYGTFWQII